MTQKSGKMPMQLELASEPLEKRGYREDLRKLLKRPNSFYSSAVQGKLPSPPEWGRGVIPKHSSVHGIGVGPHSQAHDINNRGQVVGYSYIGSGSPHAFLWEDGEMTDLGTLGGYDSEANGINDRGQVAGFSRTRSGYRYATLWTR